MSKRKNRSGPVVVYRPQSGSTEQAAMEYAFKASLQPQGTLGEGWDEEVLGTALREARKAGRSNFTEACLLKALSA